MQPTDAGGYALRLYVTGLTPLSVRAVSTLRELCDAHLAGRYELEVIDLYQHPERAAADQVVAAPTLVRLRPPPVRHLIGDLSDRARVLAALDIRPGDAAP